MKEIKEGKGVVMGLDELTQELQKTTRLLKKIKYPKFLFLIPVNDEETKNS